jgi:hypothetical protein
MSDPAGSSSSSFHIRTTEHQLTQAEVVPVVYRQVFHQWQTWILPVAGICLVVAGAAVLALDSSDTVAWVVMLTLGAVVLLIFFIAVPLTPNRIWRRVKKQFAVRTLEITDEGISRHTTLNDSLLKWPMFSDVELQDDLYLLTVGKGPGCFMIPRRAFISQVDEEAFRDLAERSTAVHSDHQAP